ncbi:hypothetical protein [Candidatus Neoehrlichia procyonis]|uniref:Uncharacterized protein n=1 Tax=Candidatus Neoehrlichia procyonis str. RAC413 TaxID=1359163 RepID=A0A0F3NM25_9RICK|nr:hypothetical protein [Candidatus Neoehrlichia lotoris]KJV69103.1 hypothetical protein NLO413_0479 [Candidatus Neoehrlichia lotoris str. RAC413]
MGKIDIDFAISEYLRVTSACLIFPLFFSFKYKISPRKKQAIFYELAVLTHVFLVNIVFFNILYCINNTFITSSSIIIMPLVLTMLAAVISANNVHKDIYYLSEHCDSYFYFPTDKKFFIELSFGIPTLMTIAMLHVVDSALSIYYRFKSGLRGDLKSDFRGDVRGDLRGDLEGDLRGDLYFTSVQKYGNVRS